MCPHDFSVKSYPYLIYNLNLMLIAIRRLFRETTLVPVAKISVEKEYYGWSSLQGKE